MIPLSSVVNHFFHSDLAALTHRDDEYAWAGVEDPKIVVTTSHNPSSRLKQFAKVVPDKKEKLKSLPALSYFTFCVYIYIYIYGRV